MNNNIKKLNQFHDYLSILITANNEISELMPDVINEYPILHFKTLNALLYDVLKYSRTIKELIRLDSSIKNLNSTFFWDTLIQIGDKLAHKYININFELILTNINDAFIPLMTNLNNLKLPQYFNFPDDLELIKPITIDSSLLHQISFLKM
jgi:uncharacterized protein with HEPN domain